MGRRISTWSLITYLSCPLQYERQFGVGGTGWKPSLEKQKEFSYGKILHATIQEAIFTQASFNDACKSLWTKLQMELQAVDVKDLEFLYYQGATWLSKLWQKLPRKEQVVGLEQPFSIDVGVKNGEQYYATGRYDLLLKDGDMNLIADLKTRSKLYDDLNVCWDMQLAIYSWSFWKNSGVIPYIRFYDLLKSIDAPTDVQVRITTSRHTEASIQIYDSIINEAIEGIAFKKFSRKSGFGCSWCSFNNQCFETTKAKIEYL